MYCGVLVLSRGKPYSSEQNFYDWFGDPVIAIRQNLNRQNVLGTSCLPVAQFGGGLNFTEPQHLLARGLSTVLGPLLFIQNAQNLYFVEPFLNLRNSLNQDLFQ
jgi:hypothetical protein